MACPGAPLGSAPSSLLGLTSHKGGGGEIGNGQRGMVPPRKALLSGLESKEKACFSFSHSFALVNAWAILNASVSDTINMDKDSHSCQESRMCSC